MCTVAAYAEPAASGDSSAGRNATLIGRVASFKTLAYDDPAKPLFDGLVHSAEVGDGVEFGLGPEGSQNNLDVVPALIDISAHRIQIIFAVPPQSGVFVASAFNGYLLSFEPDCLVIESAAFDWSTTNAAFRPSDLITEGRTLKINLAGRTYDETVGIAIDLAVDDCPMS